MRARFKRALSIVSIVYSVQLADAQDLAPRAYIITPIHSNALTLTYFFDIGNLIFDGETPINDARAKVSVSVFNLTCPQKLAQTKCDFSNLEWPAQGQEEESCARVDSTKSRPLAS